MVFPVGTSSRTIDIPKGHPKIHMICGICAMVEEKETQSTLVIIRGFPNLRMITERFTETNSMSFAAVSRVILDILVILRSSTTQGAHIVAGLATDIVMALLVTPHQRDYFRLC